MSDEMPRARRRERRADNPRSHRVNLAYNDVELAIIMTAAAVAGLKPAAYAARAALAVAKEEVSPAPVDYKDRLRMLADARVAANRIGTNLNQIARVMNSEGEETPERLESVLERVEIAVRRLDEATIAMLEGRA
ncbi:plasmid mobilization relaxosome protein MobC [Streptomyces sp. NBC_01750]|uniref:plasmid mobilization relaxosome protein MobC n=1 Tax=Streptomyces sp. NBC_01750 TaxID=2975928 RepID=UPI002DDBC232|nr:plasmid mobilization relaxosome protein MobC [Streptomyces sp. NBC_01750]WSD38178.1 MobC family plasmid mobilization relaxosome protein [Streptomyces sp. NBC_01750]